MSAFKEAFAAARKAGKKEFTWNGKAYNTELKETARPKARGATAPAKSEAGPKARPVKAVAKAASVSPGGIGVDMAAIREGNQKQREQRRDARANRRLARDVRSTLKKTKPKTKDRVLVRPGAHL
jgi:hypothetical protein